MDNNILQLNEDELYNSNEEYVDSEVYLQNFNNNKNKSSNDGNKEVEKTSEAESTEEERFFNDFTIQEIDNEDPSLGNQLIKIYEEEIPFEIRYDDENLSEDKKIKSQSLLCKILITDEMIEQIYLKIEIASDIDLFFYYSIKIDLELFETIKKEQNLNCNFNDFSDLLIKYLDFCNSDQKQFVVILNVQKDRNANMQLIQNLDYKWVQLLNINFNPISEDLIRKQIIYRYNSLRAMNDITQNRINIINDVLKDFDPPLIKEVKDEISKNNNIPLKLKNK